MAIHIGQRIRQVFDESGMSVSELARRIQTTRQNVYGIFERRSIDTELLERIGKALHHNFFLDLVENSTSAKQLSSYVEEAEASYRTAKQVTSRKVVLQIEIDPDKQDKIIKMVLGS